MNTRGRPGARNRAKADVTVTVMGKRFTIPAADLDAAEGQHSTRHRRVTFLPGVSPAFDAIVRRLPPIRQVRVWSIQSSPEQGSFTK